MNHDEARFKRIVEEYNRLKRDMDNIRQERRRENVDFINMYSEHGERLAHLESSLTFIMGGQKEIAEKLDALGSHVDALTTTMNGRVKVLEAWRWKIMGALGLATGGIAVIEVLLNLVKK